MIDRFGRTIDYLRISATDRCNLRCLYCMPLEGVPALAHADIMSFEEIAAICKCCGKLGISKIKLTGGEPLVRKDLVDLVRKIKELPKIREVTLTTNGILLEENLEGLKEAGLDGINISLDSLDAEKYRKMTRLGDVSRVLRALEKAVELGFASLKINSVILREYNLEEVEELASLAKRFPICVRFIEMMPIGNGKEFQPVFEEELRARLSAFGKLLPCGEAVGNGPARYYQIEGFQGKIGFISAVSHEFCGECNRIRLTADGFLKPCLQYKNVLNVKELLRNKISEDELTEKIGQAIYWKPEHHQFAKGQMQTEEQIETRNMAQIGG